MSDAPPSFTWLFVYSQKSPHSKVRAFLFELLIMLLSKAQEYHR